MVSFQKTVQSDKAMNSKFFHTNLHELARLVDLAGLQKHANEKGEDSAAVLHVTGESLKIV